MKKSIILLVLCSAFCGALIARKKAPAQTESSAAQVASVVGGPATVGGQAGVFQWQDIAPIEQDWNAAMNRVHEKWNRVLDRARESKGQHANNYNNAVAKLRALLAALQEVDAIEE